MIMPKGNVTIKMTSPALAMITIGQKMTKRQNGVIEIWGLLSYFVLYLNPKS